MDGITCRQCPFATSSPPGAKKCSAVVRLAKPGLFLTYIPHGISKINVRLWGGGGGGDANYQLANISFANMKSPIDPAAGGGGGFSSCNISVQQNSYIYVLVGGGGKAIFKQDVKTGGPS